jgi:GNAT superfamily N-acetyltransferase
VNNLKILIMHFISITSVSPLYKQVESLLITAFPESERRDLELQCRYADHNPKFKVYAVYEADVFVGFFTLWTFQSFSYVEHLAVSPSLRNKGYGTRILQYIKEIVKTPLLLEIELPFDMEQKARQLFYEKNGFQTLDLPYFQPPYRSGDACLPMHLMMYGNQGGVADERLKKSVATWVQQMYAEVYKFTPCDEVGKSE